MDEDQDGDIDCEDSDCIGINTFTAKIDGGTSALRLAGSPFSFSASATSQCLLSNLQIKWDFGDGKPLVTGASVSYAFDNPEVYDVRATVTCTNCASRTSTVTAKVARITLTGPRGNPADPAQASALNEFVFRVDGFNVLAEVPVSATVEPASLRCTIQALAGPQLGHRRPVDGRRRGHQQHAAADRLADCEHAVRAR